MFAQSPHSLCLTRILKEISEIWKCETCFFFCFEKYFVRFTVFSFKSTKANEPVALLQKQKHRFVVPL
jgi:hypothetical protein